MAVLRILQERRVPWSNMAIKWFTDNQGVVSIIRHGSRNRPLHAIARDIAAVCSSVDPQFIRGVKTPWLINTRVGRTKMIGH